MNKEDGRPDAVAEVVGKTRCGKVFDVTVQIPHLQSFQTGTV